MRNIGWSKNVNALHRPEPDVLALSGDFRPLPTLTLSSVDDFVVNVSDIRHQANLNI